MITRTRGYLPHYDLPCGTYFVTFRLNDSLPQHIIHQYRNELDYNLKFKNRERSELVAEYEARIERYLDASNGECWLRDSTIARLVVDAFKKYDRQWYVLHAYTIMPNHVHVLISMRDIKPLSEVMRHWKGATSFFANKVLHRGGAFWHREYFDRYIKTERQFEFTIRYIYRNPVKAGLCKEVFQWPWSGSSPEIQALLRKFFV